jgi:hypothetical protein
MSAAEGEAVAGSHIRIISKRSFNLTDRDRAFGREIATEFKKAEPGIGKTDWFGPLVHRGFARAPAILFGDNREIALMAETGASALDYRMGYLAGEGDLVIVGCERNTAFEAYQRQVLGLDRLDYRSPHAGPGTPWRASTSRCLRDDRVFDDLCRFVSGSGGATLLALYTSGTIWALASRLSSATGKPVDIAGPPPLLSRRANDKLWFGDFTTKILGAGSVPDKRRANGVAVLTRHVSELAKKWDRLVLKVPDSAGSAGNLVLESADIRHLGGLALYRWLREHLTFPGWNGRFPIVVEVWDANVLGSPSVQTWIPDPSDGDPVIEGVFEQALAGEEGTFVGASAASLPPGLDAALCRQGLMLAFVLQQLGYFGRCSFDSVLTGVDPKSPAIHWVECNARWGGVSIPMSFVNRIGGTSPYTIVQTGTVGSDPIRFSQIVHDYADLAPGPALDSGVVFFSPTAMEAGTGCHFLSFGETQDAADQQALAVLSRFAGRATGGLSAN